MKQHSSLESISVLFYITFSCLCPVFGFSADDSTMTRSVDQNIALTNAPVTLTVAFTNGSPNPLRGFFYAEQMPSGLEPVTLSVRLNGQSITNYMVESGLDGDVYPGCTPQRWVLELPPDFTQTNPLPQHCLVEIVYSISSATPGAFTLQDFSWAGYDTVGTNVSFGHSEPAEQQMVTFMTEDSPPYLSTSLLTNGYTIGLIGLPGYSYVLEASTNLQDWSAIATNLAPFEFKENNELPFDHRYYRAYPLQ